jgi:antitoxin component YwqK of YwqJK toxin-antitoxin module
MRYLKIPILLFSLLAFQSCKNSLTEYATDWSNNIKAKITEDANEQPDKTLVDSTNYNVTLTLYKGARKLKYFQIYPRFNKNKELIYIDTAVSIFYSRDNKFELVRELCPTSNRIFEGIRYEGQPVGLTEFRYCNGKIKETGFRMDEDVGIWKEYDSSGKIVKETDHGQLNKLQKIRDIKYYR